MAQEPKSGPGPLTVEVFRSHTNTFTHKNTHPVGLLSISDQPITEAATYTSHSQHNRRTFMLSAGFEPAISATKWLQNYALDRTATGIGIL